MTATTELSESRRTLLTAYLRGKMAVPAARQAGIPKRGGSGPAPLSHGQQQVWLHSQMAESSLIYNEPVTIHYRGALDRRALAQSFADIVHRHEAWRTTFEWIAGELFQIIHPAPATVEIPYHDLRALPSAEREGEAIRVATEDALQPFDLARGPLYRPRLVCLENDEYRLFLTLHHIIFDGVSLYRVFLPELQMFYAGHTRNAPVVLRKLPIQYPDYAAWQRDAIREILPKELAYWKNILDDLPVLELKTDHPRGATPTFAGAMEKLEISAATTEGLRKLAQEHGATLFMTVVAGFMALLHGCTGQEDIVVGSASSTRKYEETEGLLGFFLNTFVIRCGVSGDLAFSDLLACVRKATLGALSNDAVPFERLVREFAGKRRASHEPLFRVLISVEPPLAPLEAGWGLTQMDVETGVAKFDLHLELDDRPEGLIGRFIYNTTLYEQSTIRTLTTRWLKLLDVIAANAAVQVRELVIAVGLEANRAWPVADEEKRPVPAAWKGSTRPFPEHQGIHQIFEKKSALHPLATAIEFGTARLSYAELNARANQLARQLQSLGVTPGACVGTCMDRSPEFIVAILAILKVGGAFVPLDTTSPSGRLGVMLRKAGVSHVLTAGSSPPVFVGTGVKLLDLAELNLATEDTSNLDLPGAGDDVACVMFTSGSTGEPKGAEILHRGISRLVVNNDYAPFVATDVVAFAANVCFDASTFEIWGALLNGGTLAVTPSEALLSPDALASHVRTHRISVLFLTTSLFNQMAALAPGMFAGIRHLVFGGEAADPQAVKAVLQHSSPQRLVNGYGPTEATTFAVCHTVERVEGNRVPIGRPIANTEIHILDPALNPVPIGVTGELHIGGPGLARGYIGEPELTAACFPNTPHGRLYRTGDLARWLSDGTIDFLGRADWQFKRRGFRIEPAEIEAQLRRHPAVAQCAVLPRTDPAGETVPVAYLVPRSKQAAVTDADFRQYLLENLPAPLVPYQWFWLASLPLTANGKLDHRALPEPTVEIKPAREHVPARNSVHSHLIEIWEEVLQRKPIGIRDDFFEVGGHSLHAAKIVALISERLGARLNFAEFFNNPTIEQHTRSLIDVQSLVRNNHSVVINPEGRKTPVFFFHGDYYGGGLFCKTLAATIGADRPFHALHPHGLQGDEVPLTIEIMAADRLKTIRQVQPQGPYILGGYCNGSLIAHAAARMLRKAGEEVAILLMLSSDGDNVRFGWLKWTMGVASALCGEDPVATQERFIRARQRWRDREDMASYYLHATGDLLRHPSREKAAPFLRKARRLLGFKAPGSPQGSNGQTASAGAGAPPRGPLTKPYAQACHTYIPEFYDSPVVLLWPREEKPRTARGPAAGWEKVCKNCRVVEVPGHHHSCISQNSNVVLVGEAMKEAIAWAENLLIAPSL